MKIYFLLAIFTVLFLGSCVQQTSKIGLIIEVKPTRGQSYIDSSGTKFNLRHIPISISNDSIIPIQLEIAFSKQYDYPSTYNNEKFKVFPMPEIWALDGIEITDSILNELPKFIDSPNLVKIIEPGEEWQFAIGTLYPKGINYGIFPVSLFSHHHRSSGLFLSVHRKPDSKSEIKVFSL